jgi:hypothetical protein
MGLETDLRLDADYPAAAELFEGWCAVRAIGIEPPRPIQEYASVLPAVPPFYWRRFAASYRHVRQCVPRPPDMEFYRDEQGYYLAFARALGYPAEAHPSTCLPIAPSERFGVTAETVVIAPGSKTGEMAAKRWPYFPELAARFTNVAIVGTGDDLPPRPFPDHCLAVCRPALAARNRRIDGKRGSGGRERLWTSARRRGHWRADRDAVRPHGSRGAGRHARECADPSPRLGLRTLLDAATARGM